MHLLIKKKKKVLLFSQILTFLKYRLFTPLGDTIQGVVNFCLIWVLWCFNAKLQFESGF